MDKTFAETKGAASFDWNKLLDDFIAGKDGDWDQAAILARDWITCACGNQCAIIPRFKGSGQPCDQALSDLGTSFFNHIISGHPKRAKRTLRKIEARSAQLIAIELAKLNGQTE